MSREQTPKRNLPPLAKALVYSGFILSALTVGKGTLDGINASNQIHQEANQQFPDVNGIFPPRRLRTPEENAELELKEKLIAQLWEERQKSGIPLRQDYYDIARIFGGIALATQTYRFKKSNENPALPKVNS